MDKVKIEPDNFFKDKFDTTEIENDIYNQMAKTLARKIDVDLAKTPLVDILTGYTRYKIQEQEIERLNKEKDDLDCYNRHLRKEKENLNNIVANKIIEDYDIETPLKEQLNTERINNIGLRNENKRLNNIIDELEDFITDKRNSNMNAYEFAYIILGKIQELKEKE